MTDSEALTEARVRRILAEIDETAPANDGPGAVSAFYTSLSFTEVRALCTLALSALGTAPAVGAPRDAKVAELIDGEMPGMGEAVVAAGRAMFIAENGEDAYNNASAERKAHYRFLAHVALSAAPATAAEIRADDAPAWFDACWKISGTGMSKVQFLDKYQQHLGVSKEVADRMRRALSEGSGNGK